VANVSIIPLQDVLRLDSTARLNKPGTSSGNWTWRFHADALTPDLACGLRLLTSTYGRAVNNR